MFLNLSFEFNASENTRYIKLGLNMKLDLFYGRYLRKRPRTWKRFL